LVSLGIDYEFEIVLNGEEIFHQEGLFTIVNIDLTDKLTDKNQLLVKINPFPKLHSSPADRTQASQVTKPAVSYGWDWHPRLVPLGMWDDTYLELSGKNLPGTLYVWILRDTTGKDILMSEGVCDVNRTFDHLELSNPVLWWTHDQGMPYLCSSSFQLIDHSGKAIMHTAPG
jgi:beta-mannosidase